MILLKPNGQRDLTFQSPPDTFGTISKIIADRDGLIVISNLPMVRLLSNGNLDSGFPPAGGGQINDAIRLSPTALLLASGTTPEFNGGQVPSVFSVFSQAPSVDFSVGGLTVAENAVSFEVTIRATGTMDATLASVDDSAIAGTHFTAISETLSFDPASLEQTVTVTIADDALANATRSFTLQLTSPEQASIPVFNVQILDDESAPIIVTQPESQLVPPGQSATLTLGLQDATGASFLWYRNGAAVNNATSSSYQPTFAGNYFVEVTRNGVTIVSDSASIEFQQDGSAIHPEFSFGSPQILNPVNAIANGPLGAAYVGAQSQTNGRGALSRVLPDNTTDPAWDPSIIGFVSDLVVEPDGSTVIVGDLDIRDVNPLVTGIARYQSDATRDLAFQANVGNANGDIRLISRYENGDLLVGGSFSEWNGVSLSPNSSLVKLDSLGNRIPVFNPDRFGNPVSAVALPDGGALVIYSSSIYHLDASGTTVSQKFLNNGLREISSAGSGKWLVVSSQNFSFGGTSGTVARLDSNLNIEQVFPVSKALTAITQPNGKIVVGGTFISGGHRKIIRFLSDGTIDSTFSTSYGLRTFSEIDGKEIKALTGRSDGSIWVGGIFDGYGANNQVNFPNLVRINGDPVVLEVTTQPVGQFVSNNQDLTLTAGASSDLPLTYQWLFDGVPLTDGAGISGAQTTDLTLSSPITSGNYQLRITGGPATVDTASAFVGVLDIPVIRRITDGLTSASGLPLLLQVEAFGQGLLTYQWFKNGSPLAGQTSPLINIPASQTSDSGTYTVTITNALGDITSDPIEIEILQNGAAVLDDFPNPSVGGQINDLLVLPGDRVLIGGDFFNFNSADFSVQGGRYLAAMKTDGTVLPDHGLAVNNRVQALALQADGKIIVAGTFSSIGGMPRKQVARLNDDLTLDATFDPGDVLPGFATIYQVAVDSDDKILVVHSDRNANYLTRLLSDGSPDPSFVVNPSSLVREIIPQDDGTYFVAGYFSNWDQTGLTSDSGLVKIANDGSLLASPDFITTSNRIDSLFQFSNGDLLASNQNLALDVLGADGQAVTGRFDNFTPNSAISSVVQSAEGLTYLGGLYTEINGNAVNRLVRTTSDGEPDPSFNVGTGFNNSVQALALNEDGSLWVAGRFTQYNGAPASYITLLTGSREPPATRSFTDFISATNLDPIDQGFTLDPDQDGYSNGLEFLFGGNPAVADPALLPAPQLQPGTALGMAFETKYLTMEISIAEDLANLPWAVRASTDLNFDNGENAVQVGEPTIANGLATYLFRMPWSIEDFEGKGFLRVTFTNPE